MIFFRIIILSKKMRANVFLKALLISCFAFVGSTLAEEGGNSVTVNIEVPPPSELPKVMAPTPTMPDAPEDPAKPSAENQAPKQMISETQVVPVATPIPFDAANQVTLQSVVLVNLPKADASILDKFIEAHDSGDFEKYAELFSDDGFNIITGDFKTIKSKQDLKAQWDKKFANDKYKNVKLTSSLDTVKDLAPGIAMLTGKFDVNGEAIQNISSKFTMVVKYDDNEWKILSLHGSSKDIMKMMFEAENPSGGSDSATMTFIVGLLGLVIGFVLAKFLKKKK